LCSKNHHAFFFAANIQPTSLLAAAASLTGDPDQQCLVARENRSEGEPVDETEGKSCESLATALPLSVALLAAPVREEVAKEVVRGETTSTEGNEREAEHAIAMVRNGHQSCCHTNGV
jgi:hypothetical protein